LQTPERFVSLAELLRPSESAPPQTCENEPAQEELAPAECDAARDVRLFRARIAEALDAAVALLCRDIACDVVARELRLEPADISAIVDRAIQRYECESITQVRVHPADAPALAGMDVCPDASLRRGDAVLDVAAGTIDVSLGVRLDSVLRALR